MAVQTANPGGVGNQTRDGLTQKLNFTNSSIEMPELKDAIYGAFSNIPNQGETSESADPNTYAVYQNIAQTYDRPDLQQYSYGTASNPVTQWVQRIQTGTRVYDPSNDFDNSMLEEYEKMYNSGQADDGALSPDELMKQIGRDTVGQLAGQVGGRVGQAIVDPYLASKPILERAIAGGKTTFTGKLPYEEVSSNALNKADLKLLNKGELTFDAELANKDAATAVGRLEDFENVSGRSVDLNAGLKNADVKLAYKPLEASKLGTEGAELGSKSLGQVEGTQVASRGSVVTGGTNAVVPDSGYFSNVGKELNWNTDAGAANWGSAAGAAGFSFVANLAMGAKPKEALKSAAGTMIGRVIGQALIPIPGVGAFIGGVVGGALGGRVICNELCKQGIMDRKQVVLDYKFTRDYLTPQHVIGYHVWAVWMVKQMRKGRLVSFWSHVAGHRANEIEYIYGEREKPDYLGKVYRKILEPICWTLGAFCKKTDWSVLYQKKEI